MCVVSRHVCSLNIGTYYVPGRKSLGDDNDDIDRYRRTRSIFDVALRPHYRSFIKVKCSFANTFSFLIENPKFCCVKNAFTSNVVLFCLGRGHESVAVKETVRLSFLEQQFCMNFHKAAVLSKCPAIITSHLHSCCCCIVALGIKAKCGGTHLPPSLLWKASISLISAKMASDIVRMDTSDSFLSL